MAKHPGFADAGIATNLYKPVLIQRGIDFGDDVEPRQMHSCESVADIGKRETGHLFQSFTGWPEITIARQAKSALRKLIRQRLTMKRSADLPGGNGNLDEIAPQRFRDRKSTRLNSSHLCATRMPPSACKNNKTHL